VDPQHCSNILGPEFFNANQKKFLNFVNELQCNIRNLEKKGKTILLDYSQFIKQTPL
jgi:hypothetical protein